MKEVIMEYTERMFLCAGHVLDFKDSGCPRAVDVCCLMDRKFSHL